jgi:hypothetical protein
MLYSSAEYNCTEINKIIRQKVLKTTNRLLSFKMTQTSLKTINKNDTLTDRGTDGHRQQNDIIKSPFIFFFKKKS